MLERTDAVTNEVLETFTFVLAYCTAYINIYIYIHIFFNNVNIIITLTCFDTSVLYSGISKVVLR